MVEETTVTPIEISGKLFSVAQVTLAAFIGAPIAGCLLLAKNYRELGDTAAWKTLAGGIVSTIILFGISYLLPENFPSAVLPVAYCVGMRGLAKYLQGAVTADQEARGKRGSWAITVGVGIGCLIVILGFILATVMVLIPE